MLALLLVAAAFSSTRGYYGSIFSTATPLDAFIPTPRVDTFDQSQCTCPNTRSLLDILWTCLATIFLCTWVSVHPNLPPPDEFGFKTFLRRLKLMLSAVAGPEMILMFSMRQWVSAREEVKRYKRRKWTMAHGHFLIMGGFVLMKDKKDMGTVSSDLLHQLTEAGEIEFPSLTENEIEDKSKGDFLSKSLVIIQTLWFTIQCIARGVQGLDLTELEIATLAFCSLNAVMYFFWWNKPLDVQCRVPIYLKTGSNYEHPSEPEKAEPISDVELASAVATEGLEVVEVEEKVDEVPVTRLEEELEEGQRPSFLMKLRVPLFAGIKLVGTIFDPIILIFKNAWHATVNKDTTLPAKIGVVIGFLLVCVPGLVILPLFVMVALFGLLLKLLGEPAGLDSHAQPLGQDRVQTFYSPRIDMKKLGIPLIAVFVATATVVGGIHCIAWGFRFPTHAERLLWQSSSIALAVIPIITLSLTLIRLVIDLSLARKPPQQAQSGLRRFLYIISPPLRFFCFGLLLCLIPLYIFARFILLVESFIALRELSLSALLDIDWQKVVPHL